MLAQPRLSRLGITPFSLGTDGGGSIRIPAAFTGLAGIKGQFGRVPVWPTSATPTLAHVGPLARSVQDAALLFSVIAGLDRRDPFSVAGPVPDVLGSALASVTDLRIAYSPTLGYARPDPEVIKLTDMAASTFREPRLRGRPCRETFSTPILPIYGQRKFYAGVGIRLRSFMENQRELLDPAVADVLEPALSQDMRDYYTKVFARYALRDKINTFFERYDILISPVIPVTSLNAGQNIPDGLEDRNLVSWVFYTYPFNLTGQPAASVCAGIAPDGMPVGLQIVGRSYCEGRCGSRSGSLRAQPSGWI